MASFSDDVSAAAADAAAAAECDDDDDDEINAFSDRLSWDDEIVAAVVVDTDDDDDDDEVTLEPDGVVGVDELGLLFRWDEKEEGDLSITSADAISSLIFFSLKLFCSKFSNILFSLL